MVMVEVTGIIVAGGRSNRMGQDKALLQLGGVTVLERIAAVLGQVAKRVIVVTRDTQQYRELDLETTKDLYPGLYLERHSCGTFCFQNRVGHCRCLRYALRAARDIVRFAYSRNELDSGARDKQ